MAELRLPVTRESAAAPGWSLFWPLSGDVTQAINPWTWMQRITDSQIGVVTINLGRSSDPALERRIITTVASYGSQIGRIADVLALLVARLDLAALAPEERAAVHDFLGQYERIRQIKQERPEGDPAPPS